MLSKSINLFFLHILQKGFFLISLFCISLVKESISIKELSLALSNKTKGKPFKPKVKNTDLLNIEREMSEAFGHKIEIETKNKNSGKVSINYSSLNELDDIISKIKNKK